MIANNSHRYIFVHVPKTAGSAVTTALLPTCKWNDVELGGSWAGRQINPFFRKRHGLHKHSTASEIRQIVGEEVWADYFTFAIVRDPVDRTASIFHYLRKWRAWNGSDIMDEFADESEFVMSKLFKGKGPGGLFRPQTYWLDTQVDYIGRFEHLSHDFGEIMEKLGLPTPKMERVNESGRRGKAQFSDEAMKIIRARYEEDFVLLDRLNQQMSGVPIELSQ
jgi:hypothetical protein